MKYDYDCLEKELKELSSFYRRLLGEKRFKEIDLYINHNEFGEAFTLLCSFLSKNNISISSNNYDLLSEIGMKMRLDSQNWSNLEIQSDLDC